MKQDGYASANGRIVSASELPMTASGSSTRIGHTATPREVTMRPEEHCNASPSGAESVRPASVSFGA